MKIIERVKNLERLCLPETAGSSDTTWFDFLLYKLFILFLAR